MNDKAKSSRLVLMIAGFVLLAVAAGVVGMSGAVRIVVGVLGLAMLVYGAGAISD